MLDILLLCLLATVSVGPGYWFGRRERRKRMGVYVIFAAPRDDVDIDIPRRQDTQRFVS